MRQPKVQSIEYVFSSYLKVSRPGKAELSNQVSIFIKQAVQSETSSCSLTWGVTEEKTIQL